MANRKVYDVAPDGRDWKVELESSGDTIARTATQADAIKRARKLAKDADLGQVRVHGRDGRLRTEYTYGRDPRQIPG
jgi:hypothetical protein